MYFLNDGGWDMELNLVTSLFLAVMVYLIGAYLVKKYTF